MTGRSEHVERLRRLSTLFTDFLLPPICVDCHHVGSLICDNCLSRMSWIEAPVCLCCGRPAARGVRRCSDCRGWSGSSYIMRAALAFDGPVQKAIHALKYQGAFALATPVAEWMLDSWPNWARPVECVVPLPLHPERERQRGYNQSTLLADHLARQLALPLNVEALARPRRTRPQVGLSLEARQANVRSAFKADPERVRGRAILLIDDVYTTGATLHEASLSLLKAGATFVICYCAAQATAS